MFIYYELIAFLASPIFRVQISFSFESLYSIHLNFGRIHSGRHPCYPHWKMRLTGVAFLKLNLNLRTGEPLLINPPPVIHFWTVPRPAGTSLFPAPPFLGRSRVPVIGSTIRVRLKVQEGKEGHLLESPRSGSVGWHFCHGCPKV